MKHLILPFLCLLIFACGNTSKECTYGSPAAIFNKELKNVLDHQFSTKGQEAQENIVFDNGLKLEVLQGGCNSLKQEFRFTLNGNVEEDGKSFWINQAGQLFHFLGSLSDQYLVYHQYAQALKEAEPQMNLRESFLLGEGFFIKLDHISGTDYELLVVEVAQGQE